MGPSVLESGQLRRITYSAKFVHFYTLLLSSRTYEYSLVYLPRSGEGLYVLPVLIIQRPGAHGHGAISWVGSWYVSTIFDGSDRRTWRTWPGMEAHGREALPLLSTFGGD